MLHLLPVSPANPSGDTVSVTITGITGVITDASEADPTVITSAGHKLRTGDTVLIEDCDAVTDPANAINGIAHEVTVIDDDTFSIPVEVTSAGTEGTWQRLNTNTKVYAAWEDADPSALQHPPNLGRNGLTITTTSTSHLIVASPPTTKERKVVLLTILNEEDAGVKIIQTGGGGPSGPTGNPNDDFVVEIVDEEVPGTGGNTKGGVTIGPGGIEVASAE